MRIGIIGGGPAGLSAAHFLKLKGYREVTVLERAGYVGGKCESVHYQGRSIDLGGDFITPEYKSIISLTKELGLTMRHVPKRHSVDMDTGRYSKTLTSVMRDTNFFSMTLGALRYAYYLWRYRRLGDPGYDGLEKEAMQPFGDWLDEHGMSSLRNYFVIAVNVFGYGINYNDLPAAYVLKFVGWTNFFLMLRMGMNIAFFWPKHFNQGFQHFWERVAWELDVRLDCQITEIRRNKTVTVKTKGGEEYEFDRIILACPFDSIAEVMDSSPEEDELFGKILYNDYYSACCVLDPMPEGLVKRGTIDTLPITPAGHPWAMVRAWPDRDAVLFFSTPETSIRQSDFAPVVQRNREILEHIRNDVETLGGQVKEVLAIRRWVYFPHVSSEDMRDGFYERMEALQGQQLTYYSWSLMNFETVHHVTKYSKNLVERFFPSPDPTAA